MDVLDSFAGAIQQFEFEFKHDPNVGPSGNALGDGSVAAGPLAIKDADDTPTQANNSIEPTLKLY